MAMYYPGFREFALNNKTANPQIGWGKSVSTSRTLFESIDLQHFFDQNMKIFLAGVRD